MPDSVFSVVVADDEEELREAICRMIDWESIGFRLVGSAGNGLDALQLAEQLQPDLLLTDIQMPFITGIELARQVREVQPLIQVAFLSGYDDFEYAQRAIENRVISYLLKPISMSELTDALKDIHSKMVARFNELRPVEGHVSKHASVASLLLDPNAEYPEEDQLYQQLQESGMRFSRPYSLVVLSLSGGSIPKNGGQIVEKVLSKDYACCSIVSGNRILSLVVSDSGFVQFRPALDELYYVCRRLLSESCVIGVSRAFSDLRSCNAAYREAIDAERLAPDSGVHYIGALQSFPEMKQQPSETEAISRLLYSGDRQKLQQRLSLFFSEPPGDLSVMELFFSVRNVLLEEIGESGVSALMTRCGLTDPLAALSSDRNSFRRRVGEFALAGQDSLRRNRSEGVQYLCEQTLRIIEQNYAEETLSLNSVSEQLHVSPNYLSANMKRYAGDTFINLLIKKRMETAQDLIRQGSMKISEVAGRCGYSDQHYFSFCFKKYFGISPAKMRRGESAE